MLNSTQAIAGMIGSNKASPRLSLLPSAAISAICCVARAGSHELRVAKMAPARAVPARVMDWSDSFEEARVRPFGSFWMQRKDMGFAGAGLEGLRVLGELVWAKHFALSMAIVATVAAIVCEGCEERGRKEREEWIQGLGWDWKKWESIEMKSEEGEWEPMGLGSQDCSLIHGV